MWIWVAILVIWILTSLLDFGSSSDNKGYLIIKDIAAIVFLVKIIMLLA